MNPVNIDQMNLVYKPETYKTILGNQYGRNSLSTSIRRKMSKYLKYGLVCGKTIKFSSSDHGKEVIFYVMEKEYFIVFTKNNVFYCSNVNSDEIKTIMTDAYILKNYQWEPVNNFSIDTEEVVLCF
jgi:hypothetical protein